MFKMYEGSKSVFKMYEGSKSVFKMYEGSKSVFKMYEGSKSVFRMYEGSKSVFKMYEGSKSVFKMYEGSKSVFKMYEGSKSVFKMYEGSKSVFRMLRSSPVDLRFRITFHMICDESLMALNQHMSERFVSGKRRYDNCETFHLCESSSLWQCTVMLIITDCYRVEVNLMTLSSLGIVGFSSWASLLINVYGAREDIGCAITQLHSFGDNVDLSHIGWH